MMMMFTCEVKRYVKKNDNMRKDDTHYNNRIQYNKNVLCMQACMSIHPTEPKTHNIDILSKLSSGQSSFLSPSYCPFPSVTFIVMG